MSMGTSINNPGNIRYAADKWQGAAVPPQVGGFCSFTTPVFGIRAIARVLITNQDKHGCRTIADHISRYAPPADNNPTAQYILNVSRWTGFASTQTLDVHTYANARPLVEAIIHQEQGEQPYSDAQLDEALKLAGIVQAQSSSTTVALAKDPRVIGATIMSSAGVAQATVSSVSDIWDNLARHIDPRYLVWSCVAVMVGYAVWYALQKIKARKEGTS